MPTKVSPATLAGAMPSSDHAFIDDFANAQSDFIITDLGTISLLVTAAGVVGALAWYWVVRGTPLRVLFERPVWARLKPARIPAMQPAE